MKTEHLGLNLLTSLVIFGWIGDRLHSRQAPFLFGLAFLAGTTACFMLGSTVAVLLIARLLQGFSSAVVFTFGRALLLDRVGHERIGQAIGYTSIAMSAGLLLGPVIGGVLYQFGGYYVVFLVPIGMIVAEILLRLLIIEPEKLVHRMPYVKQAPQQNGQGGHQVGKSDGSNDTASTIEDESGNDIYHQRADEVPDANELESEPLLQVVHASRSAYVILLQSPRFMTTITSLLILSGLANGFDAILPAYSHDTLDLSISKISFLFLCIGVPMFLAPLSGWITDRVGPKWPAVGGLILLSSMIFLLRIIKADTSHSFFKLSTLLCVVGLGFSQAMPALQTEITAATKEIEDGTPGIFGQRGAYAQAYGLMNAAFACGSMVGPIYTGFVRVWLGWSAVTLSMSILAAIVLLCTIAITGGHGRLAQRG